jgi:hypothetical protein
MKSGLSGIIITLLAVALLLSGCGSYTTEISVSTGKEFLLPIGQTATVTGEKLSIKFDSVEGDSRCQKGVVCIQAGEARCKMQITSQGATSALTLVDRGGPEGYSTEHYNQMKYQFKLTPYPEAGHPTAAEDYIMVMTISKE